MYQHRYKWHIDLTDKEYVKAVTFTILHDDSIMFNMAKIHFKRFEDAIAFCELFDIRQERIFAKS